MVRLQKAIADSGFCSRRKAEEYIVKGKVFVNGERITELGSKVEGNEEIIVDGNAISKQDKEYYIFNKSFKELYKTNNALISLNQKYILEKGEKYTFAYLKNDLKNDMSGYDKISPFQQCKKNIKIG